MSLNFLPIPAGASTMAGPIDLLFIAMLSLTGLVALVIAVLMVYFVVHYRRGSPADRTNPPTGAFWLELTWTGTPIVVFFVIFFWSTKLFSQFYRYPEHATSIYVLARQWMWQFQHPDGRREINQLHVPLGYPVRLVMSSQDVIHSLFVPAFRLKQDVVPGRYTFAWFQPTRLGSFRLSCAQFCGIQHYAMGADVIVMRPQDYANWVATASGEPSLLARGAALFREAGCSGCHAPGSSVHAPDLHEIYGRQTHLTDGRNVIADENYLLDCMLEPDKERVLGYPPIMPTFKGQLTQADLDALVAYLKAGDAP